MGNKDVLASAKKIFLKKEKEKEKYIQNYIQPHENFAILKWELVMIEREQRLRQIHQCQNLHC